MTQATQDKIGINLRSLLDGELALFTGNLNDYNARNAFITRLETRLIQNDWITLSAGTTFERSFIASLDKKLID
jgi:hypothetical protein